MDKIIERQEQTNNLIIKYKLKPTSSICDYDYDPIRPARRFIGTFSHELGFLDRVTEIEKMKLKFSSETCAEFITALYKFLYGTPSLVVSVRDIYIDGSPTPIIITLSKILNRSGNENIIQISYTHNNVYSSIILNDEELNIIVDCLGSSDDMIMDIFIDY